MKIVRRLVPRAVRHGISARLADLHASRLDRNLARLASGSDTIVAGPWLGEVGFELLYWVPFLRWFAETYRVDPKRLLIVSRGGTASWYRPFAAGYREIFDYLTPDEFRRRHDERVTANGEQKQTQVLAFERQLLRELTLDVQSRSMLHPSSMYGLFNPFWWGHVDDMWVQRRARYRKLEVARVAGFDMPAQPYTAVKFYFNDCFPATNQNRAFARNMIQALAARGPVVSLATGLRLDDHVSDDSDVFGPPEGDTHDGSQGPPKGGPHNASEGGPQDSRRGVRMLPPEIHPRDNLALQTAIVAGASTFVGTYGGFSYLAPFVGVRSLAYYSDPDGFSRRHLLMARSGLRAIGAEALLDVQPTTVSDPSPSH